MQKYAKVIWITLQPLLFGSQENQLKWDDTAEERKTASSDGSDRRDCTYPMTRRDRAHDIPTTIKIQGDRAWPLKTSTMDATRSWYKASVITCPPQKKTSMLLANMGASQAMGDPQNGWSLSLRNVSKRRIWGCPIWWFLKIRPKNGALLL